MGHLTNPAGFRVGRTVRWPYRWATDKLSYFKYFFIVLNIQNYLQRLFLVFFRIGRKTGILFSHMRLIVALRTWYLRIFVYSRDFLRLSKRKFVLFLARARFYFPREGGNVVDVGSKKFKRY